MADKAPEKIFEWYRLIAETGNLELQQSTLRFFENARLHLLVLGGVLAAASYSFTQNRLFLIVPSVVAFLAALHALAWRNQVLSSSHWEAKWRTAAAEIEVTSEFRSAVGVPEIKVWSDEEVKSRLSPLVRRTGSNVRMYVAFIRGLIITYAVLAVSGLVLWIKSSGISNTQGIRPLSSSVETQGSIVATIQYRPEGCVDSQARVGCYYYTVTLKTQSNFDPRTNGIGEPVDRSHCGFFTRVHLSFYDEQGFSLYRNDGGTDNTLAPGWNNNPDEILATEGGWKWLGRFTEACLPLGSFRQLTVMKARLGRQECTTSQ
jgi:hypothetical protein